MAKLGADSWKTAPCADLIRYDALIYAQALSNRSPGTHTLHFIERGDHNFTGIPDEVVDAILRWWNSRSNGEVKTGISVTDFPSGSCKL